MAKSTAVAGLTPLLDKLIAVLGRRADDPELLDFVTNTLGVKRVPDSATDASDTKNVVVKKLGIELAFGHDLKNERYPLVPKTKKTYVPYLHLAWLNPGFPEPLPFGLTHTLAPDEIATRLGVAPGADGEPQKVSSSWSRELDPTRDIVLGVLRWNGSTEITIGVAQACELASRHHPPLQQVGLFLAWAIQRNLLDESRFSAHADLIAAIRNREKRGSELLTAALPRGLWNVHLKDLPDLRIFAHRWFHNLDGSYIVFDLIKVFGARPGPHGHDEPVLDDDDWKAVTNVTKVLDKRFLAWVKGPV